MVEGWSLEEAAEKLANEEVGPAETLEILKEEPQSALPLLPPSYPAEKKNFLLRMAFAEEAAPPTPKVKQAPIEALLKLSPPTEGANDEVSTQASP